MTEEQKINQKPRSNMFKIGIGVLALIVLGAGVWAALLRSEPEPAKVVEQMISKMREVKTLRAQGQIGFEAETEAVSGTSTVFKIDSEWDSRDQQTPKSSSKIDIAFGTAEQQFSLTAQTIGIGKTLYFRITSLPAIPFLGGTTLDVFLAPVKDQWIAIDEEALREMGFSLPENLEEQEEFHKKIQVEITKLLNNKDFYAVQEVFPEERVGGVRTFHYLVVFNKEEIKKTILEIYRLISEETPTEQFGYPALSQEELQVRLDEFFANIPELSTELWIGKNDSYLYRMKYSREIDLSLFEATAGAGKILVELDINLSNFNQPLTIEPPANYQTISEFLNSFFGQFALPSDSLTPEISEELGE